MKLFAIYTVNCPKNSVMDYGVIWVFCKYDRKRLKTREGN